MNLDSRVTNALMRSHLKTLNDVMDFIEEGNKPIDIRNLGVVSGKTLMETILDYAWDCMDVKEKAEFLRTYEAHKIVDKMGKEWSDQIKRTELARAAYRKDKTIENADKLLACVEGGKYYGDG